jgi:hypothetical protein
MDLFARQLQAKAERLESPRQIRMIEVFSEHTEAEIDGNLDRLMATMNPDPIFYVHHAGGDLGPKGWSAVRDMYVEMFSSRTNYMEMDYQCIVVDDETLIAEFKQRKILPGRIFLQAGAYRDALGETADSSAYYLSEGRAIVIVPFDDECRMMGEHSFSSGKPAVRKLASDELPDAYRERYGL